MYMYCFAICLQDGARIVGLAVSIEDDKIFWSDVNILRSGIYSADISFNPTTLENARRIVSHGKIKYTLSCPVHV